MSGIYFLSRAEFDRAGRPVIPLELKILGVLRILGRGWCLDDVKESSGISEAAMCEFFHLFCERCVQEYYHDFVKRMTFGQ